MTDPIRKEAEEEAKKLMKQFVNQAFYLLPENGDELFIDAIAPEIEKHLRESADIEQARQRACKDAEVLAEQLDAERAHSDRLAKSLKSNVRYKMTYDNPNPEEVREMKKEWEPEKLKVEDLLKAHADRRKDNS